MIKNNQTILDSVDCISEHRSWSEVAVDDYIAISESLITITNLLNSGDLSPIIGTGSPEGVEEANYSLKYIDTSGPTEYYNPSLGSKTGWVSL